MSVVIRASARSEWSLFHKSVGLWLLHGYFGACQIRMWTAESWLGSQGGVLALHICRWSHFLRRCHILGKCERIVSSFDFLWNPGRRKTRQRRLGTANFRLVLTRLHQDMLHSSSFWRQIIFLRASLSYLLMRITIWYKIWLQPILGCLWCFELLRGLRQVVPLLRHLLRQSSWVAGYVVVKGHLGLLLGCHQSISL